MIHTLDKELTGTFVPFDARILVRLDAEDDLSAGGIALPTDESRGHYRTGEVLAMGPGRHLHGQRVPVQCNVGDRIMFGRNTGVPFRLNGEEVRVMTENEVFGRLG